MKDTQSREELMIENAVLKVQKQFTDLLRTELKEQLSPLQKNVADIDDRLKVVEDVLAPFIDIRKKAWFVLVASAFGVGAVMYVINQISH